MKNSKILIFILSVILLIVVIKFMKGCGVREDFNTEATTSVTTERKKLKPDGPYQSESNSEVQNLAMQVQWMELWVQHINNDVEQLDKLAAGNLGLILNLGVKNNVQEQIDLSAYATKEYVNDIIGI